LWFNGQWTITVTDLGLVKDIMTKTDLYPKALLEESFPTSLITKYYGTNVVLSNGDVWKRHRRIANPSFRNLPVHVFVESTTKLLNVMEKIDNEPIEVKSLMHRLALDVLGKAAFGFDFNNLEDPNNVYVTTYNEVMAELSKPLYFVFSFLDYLPRFEALRKIEKLNSLYDEIVESKHKAMKMGEIEKKINNKSADLLEHMVYACNDPDNPTLTNEELRVAQLPQRFNSQEIKFRNHVIPAKTPIELSIYGIHHSSRNWKDPEKFIPERFENEKHDHYSWLGFGGGNRLCLGINFSLIEQRIILCALLRKLLHRNGRLSIHKDKLQIEPEVSGTSGPHPVPLIFKRRTE
ncbi:cytochrome P450, partial [Rhizophagus irregularis]